MRPKTLLWFCGLTLAHYVATFVTLLFSFGSSMDRFESARAAGMGEKIIGAANDILSFPILPLLQFVPVRFPGLAGHLPLLANSALWVVALLCVLKWFREKEAISEGSAAPERAAGPRLNKPVPSKD